MEITVLVSSKQTAPNLLQTFKQDNMKQTKLEFSTGNTKLQDGQAIFDLPAGHACPFASACLSSADPKTGKITDGVNSEFRCYAASQEAVFTNVRLKRWRNFEALKGLTRSQMRDLILSSLPKASLYRVHSSGDFFNLAYFQAWLDVARAFPDRTFYAYTKAIPFLVKCADSIPANFKFTASMGGKFDELIAKHDLKHARVFLSESEANIAGLDVDHDDSHAWKSDKSFALVIHGTQPAGTPAAAAWQIVRQAKMAAKQATK